MLPNSDLNFAVDFLGGPSWGVHADLVASEIFQRKEWSVNWLSVNCVFVVCELSANCLLIAVNCLSTAVICLLFVC